jgi:ADP-heptose:LPS heptosyltransferase
VSQRVSVIKRVLVIKLGALGDFAQAFGVMAEIRAAHPDAEITLLTTPLYEEVSRDSGLFDRIETDGRLQGPGDYWRVFRRLRAARYDRVYDLHTSSRTRWYLLFFWPRLPEWSGISPGASFRQTRPDRTRLHNLDRLWDQVNLAGVGQVYPIGEAPAPDLSWAIRIAGEEVGSRFGLTAPFALLAPAASATGDAKRWPIEHYAALAAWLAARNITPVVVGGPGEREVAAFIMDRAPETMDLTGRTRVVDLAGLAAQARLMVGNDTGPTHWGAYAGAPGLMLMSVISRVGHCEPRARMRTLTVDDLKALAVDTVTDALEAQGLA